MIMLYVEKEINGTNYQFRLDAKSCVALEDKLGANPLTVIMQIDDKHLPTIKTIVTIWHYALQKYQHNMTMDDTYNLYDEFMNEGNTIVDGLNLVVDILKCSGFVPEKENKAKN